MFGSYSSRCICGDLGMVRMRDSRNANKNFSFIVLMKMKTKRVEKSEIPVGHERRILNGMQRV